MKLVGFLFVILLSGSIVSIITPYADAWTIIPPTRAYSKITSGNSSMIADSYRTNMTITAGDGIAIEVFGYNQTLKISANNSTNATGYVTAGNNVGVGTGQVFRDKTSTTLNFKTLKAGSNISITNNVDDVTITSTANGSGITKANNLNGGDAKIFATNSSTQVTAKTLTAGSGITITNGTKTITIASTGASGFTNLYGYPGGDAKVIRSNASNTGVFKSMTSGGGISITNGTDTLTITNTRTTESTTGSNLGTSGTGVFSALIGFDLQFKKLISSTLSITSNSTNVILEAVSSGFTKINSLNGGTASIVATNQSNQATFKTLTQGTGITITNGTKTLTITNAGVTSLTGTSRNVTVSASTGAVTVNVGDAIPNYLSSGNYTAGAKQVFTASSTNAPIRVKQTADPSTLNNGDLWVDSTGVWRTKTSASGSAQSFLTNTNSPTVFSKPLDITNFWQDSTDTTKRGKFALSSVTTAHTQTLTWPNKNGTIATTADVTGFTKINNVGSGTIKLVQTNSSNTANIKSISTTTGITLTNGTTSADISTNFKVNTKTAATRQFLTDYNNATSSGNFGTITFGANNISCGAGTHLATFTNSTGAFTCTSDTGTGITQVNSLDGGTATILGTNTTSKVTTKTLTQGTGITITNGSKTITISSSVTQGYTKANNLDGGTASIFATNSSNQLTGKTLTQGTGITITNGTKSITITNVGVTSLSGTSNNVTVSASTGAVTVNLGSNVVTTGGSTQTITKGLTINSGTLGGSLNANSQRITSLGTPTASTDADRANTMGLLGSKVINPCSNNQVLQYQTSNSTWVCATITSGSGITQVNSLDGGTASLIGTNTTSKATTKTLTQGTGITITNGSKTITIASTITQGYTKANNLDGGTASIFATNSSNQLTGKTLTAGSGISITNGSKTITITSTASGGGFTTIEHISSAGDASTLFSNSSNKAVIKKLAGTSRNFTITGNSTGLLTFNVGDAIPNYRSAGNYSNGAKQTYRASSTTAPFNIQQTADPSTKADGDLWTDTTGVWRTKTSASGSAQSFLTNTNSPTVFSKPLDVSNFWQDATDTTKRGKFNMTGVTTAHTQTLSWPNRNGTIGAYVVLASNTTTSGSASTDQLIWTIPLTASKGNTISGIIIAVSGTSGNAVQVSANVTNLGTRGYCHYITPSTTTADSVDNIVMNTVSTGRSTNTAETAWIAAAGTPMPIQFQCSLTTGSTPGNLKVWINNEISGTAIAAKAGSYYTVTP